MKTNQKLLLGILAAGTLSLTIPVQAALLFDQNVTPDAIFGSGNANGFFTVDQSGGVELGLRAKVRFVNTFNSNGAGTYTFQAGTAWNLEWSVNTDYADPTSSGAKLNSLTYGLFLNNVGGFDVINQPYLDSSIGNNSTGNGAGAEAAFADVVGYAALIAANNVAQNSWQESLFGINPNVNGTYVFRLDASNGTSTEVTVNVVPEPSTYLAGAMLLLPFGASAIRKLRKSRTA